ncbi:MAG TPA: hypothetical protein VKZ53_10970 [Candidatus Angelobacter sp.]|nr:hypothetical protein [Candidatus Angelobacter sp.]
MAHNQASEPGTGLLLSQKKLGTMSVRPAETAVKSGAQPARVTVEEVRDAVHRYWNIWQAKSSEELIEAYALNSTTFTAGSLQAEPGFIGVARRSREYFHETCILKIELGPIDVTLASEVMGLAVYTFTFHAANRAVASASASYGENSQEEHIPHGRATHLFRRESDGKLRIVHEHFSNATV